MDGAFMNNDLIESSLSLRPSQLMPSKSVNEGFPI